MAEIVSISERYLQSLNDEPQVRKALLACSAALQLDDGTACAAIEVVAKSNGSTEALMHHVKNLGCVWKDKNELWRITEDVRRGLVVQLHQEVPEPVATTLHELLAARAELRALAGTSVDRANVYDHLQARFEAAYQRILNPADSATGGQQLAKLWEELEPAAALGIAKSIDYLASEFNQYLRVVPDEVVFLRGIAARDRRDKEAQEEYFAEVWNRGRVGHRSRIHALASRLYGKLIEDRDPLGAENAFRSSIDWSKEAHEAGLAYFALGSILARNSLRNKEAEQAFLKSLTLLSNPQDRAKVHHSLGNLLASSSRENRQTAITGMKSLDTGHFIFERWSRGDEGAWDKLIPLVSDELHRIAHSYLRHERPAHTLQTTALVNELLIRFVEAGNLNWHNRAQFFAVSAQIMRRILIDYARAHYVSKREKHYQVSLSKVALFGSEPDKNLLDLHEALNRLEEIDREQARIVELRFFIGLTIKETAELMGISHAKVEREWKIARMFLKRELTRLDAVTEHISPPPIIEPVNPPETWASLSKEVSSVNIISLHHISKSWTLTTGS
jgi:RNA polymerase sigma factor (TIGR02999 family)